MAVFTPALCLAAFWVLGELALTLVAVALPAVAGGLVLLSEKQGPNRSKDKHPEFMTFDDFCQTSALTLDTARDDGRKSVVYMIAVDDHKDLVEHYGEAVCEAIRFQLQSRIRSTLRSNDMTCTVSIDTFGVCLAPQPHLDLEVCLELAGRMSRNLSEPYSIDGTKVFLTVSLGLCQLGRESKSSKTENQDQVVTCAADALQTALGSGPAAIRAFKPEIRDIKKAPAFNELDAVEGLEKGEIVPWFQPQISTDTGKITGFEALARWIHPVRGPISPAEFLPQLERGDRMNRLCEVMIYNALTAIKAWDKSGVEIQHVGVNFSSAELNDPQLVEKVSWELDRFELKPERLVIEILETVVAKGPDDVVTRNIKGLDALGCRIDLDDFGTGHSTLASIRKFGVGRIKIDRSFVMKADRDTDQQRMIKAILTMAEKLDIETLAEGVETVGEHSLLAQLGCTHVQGFGIGRPMPFDQTLQWIQEHNAKLHEPPAIGKSAV